MAEKVARECPRCPYLVKRRQNQQMANLPRERTLVFNKPYTAISLELFGPYKVKGVPNPRSNVEVYPTVFSCLSNGALHVEVASSYSADAFLAAYMAFTSVRGDPASIYTDRESAGESRRQRCRGT